MKVAGKSISQHKPHLKCDIRRVTWKMNEETYTVECEMCQF